tara:strand:- start:2539 stop:3285 length:747 start_codon:yes stop_codon:yes gene_type:complete
MKLSLNFILLLSSCAFLAEDFITEKNTFTLLERVISRYEKDFSFSVFINNDELKTKIDIDMLWLNDSSVFRKTRLNFIDARDYNGAAWIWSMKNTKDKKWITKSNGKVVDVSKRKEFNFPVILPDRSILDGYHIVSDTLNYGKYECAIIDIFKISRGRKKGPTSRLWIDLDGDLIHKIEEYDYRKNIVVKETTMEYFDSNDSLRNIEFFPKTINVRDYKNAHTSILEVSNYKENKAIDLNIFEPKEIK